MLEGESAHEQRADDLDSETFVARMGRLPAAIDGAVNVVLLLAEAMFDAADLPERFGLGRLLAVQWNLVMVQL